MTHQYTLTLMRHAKSSWKTQGQADRDRPLNARGRRDSPEMAHRLVARGTVPDLIFSSSATRALMTAEHLMDCFKSTGATLPELQIEHRLYLASPATIVTLLQAMDPGTRHILVVAHNPGLEDLSAQLASEVPTHLPTAAIRQFQTPAWSELRLDRQTLESVHLIHSDYPKNQSA